MNKPSEKAMQLADGFYLKYCDGTDDGMEGFHYFTVRSGKVLPSLPVSIIEKAKAHIARQALAEHKRVIEMAEKALTGLVKHIGTLRASKPEKTAAYLQADATLSEIEKLRKE